MRFVLIIFAMIFLLSVSHSFAAQFSGENRKNPGHDTLIKMDVDARNKKLSETVHKSGRVCPKGIKTYFQGFDSGAKAYWNVRCRRADYLLLFPRKMSGNLVIRTCEKVEEMGYPCWERNNQLTY